MTLISWYIVGLDTVREALLCPFLSEEPNWSNVESQSANSDVVT